ncbi:MAG: trimethylamine:corrinoid methyltransferase [Chloroflexi bacterium]|nr:trimethylamine:corrinoid methyltransferase [Chloroflexota bacterium]
MHLTALSKTDLEQIHQASLRVLSEVGILMDNLEGRSILFDHGAVEIDGRLQLPARLVEDSLALCPRQVILEGRGKQITLGSGDLHVHNLGGARDVFDWRSGTLTPAGVQDVAESTQLMDSLENVSSITPLYTPRDVPAELMVLAMFYHTVRHTMKPINGPGVRNSKEVRLLAEMAQVVFGDQPKISLGASPVSPLNFQGEITQTILEIARQGLPFGPLPCPNVGATAPMSLVGALVLQNAEVLACIALAQLVHPGLPIVYCGRLSVLNMRSGAPIWGNPEVGLASAGTVQIGHSYGLPVNVYGLSDSGFSADMQNGYERAINALVPALAGADELSGVGEMAGGIYSCNAQIVVDNDIYGMIRHVQRGFLVNEDSLAVDVIKHAMNSSRNFMAEPHTRRYLRLGELWQGKLGVPETTWEQWFTSGKTGVMDRAQAEADKIIQTHVVPPLNDHQTSALDEIMEAARLELAGIEM